ncbi:MAG: 50S ribosomal protein L9 [Gemmatimonas sp. SG8_28]|nr:MAG: 50S ribosomal protein L9 [Gemmatimonas sp. SG8_28]
MEVILRDDVPNLGRVGEIVKVKDGYARNYLIPQGLAYAATPGNKRRIESEAKRRTIRLAEQKSDAEATAARLAGVALAFTAKAGEGDKLFGSITSADIAKQLAQQGYTVDKRIIELAEPIRMIGDWSVRIRLHPEVRAEIMVSVTREE